MKKPRTLLLTGARKSLWTSGGVTGARLGAGPQQTKPMMAGMGSKKPRHWRAPGPCIAGFASLAPGADCRKCFGPGPFLPILWTQWDAKMKNWFVDGDVHDDEITAVFAVSDNRIGSMLPTEFFRW